MLRYLHYYLCSFHVYKLGDKNSRPHIRNHYVLAQNSYGAYNKAKAICGTDIVSRCSSDLTVCRKKDVIPVNMVEALHEIHLTPEKLIDVELGPNGEILMLAKRLCDPDTGRLIVAGTHLHILKVEASTTPSRAFPDGVDHQAEELEGEFVTVDYIDDANQIHLNESGLALIPGLDDFEIVDP